MPLLALYANCWCFVALFGLNRKSLTNFNVVYNQIIKYIREFDIYTLERQINNFDWNIVGSRELSLSYRHLE